MKAEALHLPDRISEALEAIKEAKVLVERFEGAFGVPNCTGSALFFSRLWVLRKPKLKLHFRRLAAPLVPHVSLV